MINNSLFTNNSDNWKTPTNLYNFFMNKGFIDLFEYCSTFDQYDKQYVNSLLFINPPYSHLRTKKFHYYIRSLLLLNNDIYLLIPSRTDTKFFNYFCSYYNYEIVFFTGRLHFNDSANGAPFPSCLLHLRLSDIHSKYRKVDFMDLDTFLRRGL